MAFLGDRGVTAFWGPGSSTPTWLPPSSLAPYQSVSSRRSSTIKMSPGAWHRGYGRGPRWNRGPGPGRSCLGQKAVCLFALWPGVPSSAEKQASGLPPYPCPVSTVFTLTRIRNAHVISHLQLSKRDPEAQVGSSCADAAWGVRTGALQPASPRARQPCREPWLLPAGWPRLQPRWLPGSGGGASISCLLTALYPIVPWGGPRLHLGCGDRGFGQLPGPQEAWSPGLATPRLCPVVPALGSREAGIPVGQVRGN